MVKPKQPLLDWRSALSPDLTEDGSETTVYLVNSQLYREDAEKWLTHHYKNIFENELNDRHTVENDRPKKRTYEVFKEWFDTELHEQVVDMEDGAIRKF